MTLPLARAAALAAALIAPLGAAVADAQTDLGQGYGLVDDTRAAAPGFYYFTRLGDPVVSVTAVGSIGGTGRYLLSAGTTLDELLALSGGVVSDRTGRATVRVYRDGGLAYESDVRDLYDATAAPVLANGDVVEVVGLVSTVPGYYVHRDPGLEPIRVTAAGAFAAPGQYVIDPGTTVGELAALAGGLSALGVLSNESVVTSTIRQYRDGVLVSETALEDLYSGRPDVLAAGDVVDLRVTTRRRRDFVRDVLPYVTSFLGTLLLIDRVIARAE